MLTAGENYLMLHQLLTIQSRLNVTQFSDDKGKACPTKVHRNPIRLARKRQDIFARQGFRLVLTRGLIAVRLGIDGEFRWYP